MKTVFDLLSSSLILTQVSFFLIDFFFLLIKNQIVAQKWNQAELLIFSVDTHSFIRYRKLLALRVHFSPLLLELLVF